MSSSLCVTTRSKNAAQHPGQVDRAPPRRAKGAAAAEKAAKKAAKAVEKDEAETAKKAGVSRVATFEAKDRMDEDLLDATPRPVFTPAPKRLQRTQSTTSIHSGLTPEVKTDPTSDVEGGIDNDATFRAVVESDSATESDSVVDDSVTEDDTPAPPSKKQKAVKAAVPVEQSGKNGMSKGKEVDRKGKGKQPAAAPPVMSLRETIKAAQESNDKSAYLSDSDEVEIVAENIAPLAPARPKPRKVVRSAVSANPWDGVPVRKSQTAVVKPNSGKGEGTKAKVKDSDMMKVVTPTDQALDPSDQKSLEKATLQPKVAGYVLSPTPSMLSLDQTTLFYWSISNAATTTSRKRKHNASAVQNWALTIPSNSKPVSIGSANSGSMPLSRPNSKHAARSTSTNRNAQPLPSLTTGSTARSTAHSVLSQNILITQHDPPKIIIKTEPEIAGGDSLLYVSDGGLSDNDETTGYEREDAVLSPPKGKRRVSSSVSVIIIHLTISNVTIGPCCRERGQSSVYPNHSDRLGP